MSDAAGSSGEHSRTDYNILEHTIFDYQGTFGIEIKFGITSVFLLGSNNGFCPRVFVISSFVCSRFVLGVFFVRSRLVCSFMRSFVWLIGWLVAWRVGWVFRSEST